MSDELLTTRDGRVHVQLLLGHPNKNRTPRQDSRPLGHVDAYQIFSQRGDHH